MTRRTPVEARSIAALALASLVLASAALQPSLARAGGLELLPGGTRSVSRGGAVLARPEDPMVILHNPAMLTALHGDRAMLNIELPLREMCVDLYGYYGWGVYDGDSSEFGDPLDTREGSYATTPLPEVCNSADVVPVPSIGFASQLSDEITIGWGMVAPSVVTGLRFGGSDGTIQLNGRTLPTPTRYQMIEQKIEFALAPTFALAYRFSDLLSIGANVQIAMLSARTWAIQNETSGTQPSSDWLAEVVASDYFLPSITFGARTEPLRGLDLGASFRWVDDFQGSGEVIYETSTFHRDATSGPIPFRNDGIDLDEVRVSLPWTLSVGARYAGLLEGEPSKNEDDPMGTELWDIEIDATYNLGGLVKDNAVLPGDNVTIISRTVGGGSALMPTEMLPRVHLDRHQIDSFAVRLGGSYSFLPRRLAANAGTFFESRGIEASYASIDSWAFARVGVGAGIQLRFGPVDLFAAYGHIFQETLEVVSPAHQNVEDHDDNVTSGFDKRVGGTFTAAGIRQGGMVLEDPEEPTSGSATAKGQQNSPLPSPARPERIVNAGKYSASFDIISIGVQYRY